MVTGIGTRIGQHIKTGAGITVGALGLRRYTNPHPHWSNDHDIRRKDLLDCHHAHHRSNGISILFLKEILCIS